MEHCTQPVIGRPMVVLFSLLVPWKETPISSCVVLLCHNRWAFLVAVGTSCAVWVPDCQNGIHVNLTIIQDKIKKMFFTWQIIINQSIFIINVKEAL